jgi:Ca2+/H+ antiporter
MLKVLYTLYLWRQIKLHKQQFQDPYSSDLAAVMKVVRSKRMSNNNFLQNVVRIISW